jgi:hypothetical protein
MATLDFWKVLLRPNTLTKDVDDDYIAVVSTIGHTNRREDIVREIVAEGTEFKYETVLDILTRADRIICRHVREGHSVLTGVAHITPRVLGNWIGEHATYNKAEHRITVDMNPGAELREALKDIGVEVIGMSDANAFIRMVTDSANGKHNVLTPGFDCIIDGSKVKILPEVDEETGVYLTSATGEIIKLKVTQNMPKALRAHVPADLPDSKYTLAVATRYTGSGNPLNQVRTIEYAHELTLDEPGTNPG